MIGADRGQAVAEANGRVTRIGGMDTQPEPVAVALTIAAAFGGLVLMRRGMRGIGNFELTASTVGGLEWLCYYIIVNGAVRVIQIKFPESGFSKAMFFLS